MVIDLAWKLGAIDMPGEARRMHNKPMPRLGGLAMFIAFCVGGLFTLPWGEQSVQGLILGSTVIVILGILDDIYGLPAKVKLLGQILAAWVLVYFGTTVEWVTNPLGGMIYLGKWSTPITIFWIVGIVNTLNFIDGLDGLAAGVSAISAFAIMLVNISLHQYEVALTMALLSGCAIGFLPYNFNPAKIFMGDTGSMLLGYILAAAAVEGAVKSATVIALIVPILALGLPIFDATYAILRRFVNGKPIMQADKGHVHHRLLAIGLSQKQTVIFMYLVTLSLGLCSVILVRLGVKETIIALALVFSGLLVSMRYFNMQRRTKNTTHGM
jgi:UDP-GlcNAc:undecaprenyl-phosphate GlcNAc-1-phosphate transferase